MILRDGEQPCSNCQAPTRAPHVFKNTQDRTVARLCDKCCPRCNKATA